MLQMLIGPTIEEGESLSDGLDCTAGRLVRLTMCYEWTPAPLSFQISTDGEYFDDLFRLDGYEVVIPHVVPGSAVLVPAEIGQAVGWIKFRSGTRVDPVPQEATREFAVAIRRGPGMGMGGFEVSLAGSIEPSEG